VEFDPDGVSGIDISPTSNYLTLEIIEEGLSPWPREERRSQRK
jgi:hypothetical protein